MLENKKSQLSLLTIAFLEGAAVMACELLGAKMVAPFFGTTLYSWAGVLAVTLGGLAFGYYLGGWLTTKYKPVNILVVLLLASGCFLLMMPLISTGIMQALIQTPLLLGLVISLMIFLFPPIVLFGMVGPVIIHALVSSLDKTGKTAGKVYAISTIGGVLNTLLMGFYIIPEFGIQIPAIITGIVLLSLPVILLPFKKKAIVGVFLFIFVSIMINLSLKKQNPNNIFKITHSSEGLLGQVKVVDYSLRMDSFGIIPVRGLLVNNTWQTVINRDDGTGLLDYVYFIRPLLSSFSQGKSVLLVGLGGGTLCKEIENRGLKVEAVEIDARLKKIAYKYFGLNRNTPVHIDDGRRFINKSKIKYDLIIFDAFLGENPPWHLLTLESFEKVKTMLNPGGAFFIEFYGYFKGKKGMASRSVFKTLKEAGFKTDIVATTTIDGLERNFIYVATINGFDYSGLDYSGIKYTDKEINNISDFILAVKDEEMTDAYTLTDKLPALEKLLSGPALDWRKSLNDVFRNRLVEQGYPIFY